MGLLGHRRLAMKVLHVIDSLAVGGAERSLVEILPYYRERGIRSEIVCLDERSTQLADQVRGAGVSLMYLRATTLGGRVAELRRVMRACEPELVHTTLFTANIVGRLSRATLRSPPLLTSLVSTPYEPARRAESGVPAWKFTLVRQIDQWGGAWFTDHFHANSQAVSAAAQSRLKIPPHRITVVPRGRSARRFSPSSRSMRVQTRNRLGLDKNELVLISVGRHEPQKGYRHLLEAMRTISAAQQRVTLLLVGKDGAASPVLHRLHDRLELGGQVRFLGHRDDVPQLMGCADALVLPSLIEGCPNVAIEAMGVGIPVVASDIAAIREVLGAPPTGLLVPPGDPAALARALRILCADSALRDRLGTAGRRRFLKRFTIEPVADRMTALYHQLAKRGAGN